MKVAEIYNTMSYGPSPENSEQIENWLRQHRDGFQLFIGGRWVDPLASTHFDSINPANGKPLAQVAQAGAEDIDAAVAAARQAQPTWAELGGHGRARYLYALARLVQKRAREFAVLESLDNGKPIRESRDIDVPLAIRHFYYHAGWAQLLETEFPDRQPLGVVGQIIPWNFPLLMAAWKIAPALAAGNCVVLKPAEYTSLSALLLAELCEEIQLPAGVINIVTGDGSVGERLTAHDDVNKIAFTGSTDVGRRIRIASAGSGKKLTLELGGKSPFIVFEDADLDSVVEGLVDDQGQVCCAGSRLLAQEGIAAPLLDKIKARMQKLRIGDPLDKNTDIGAIVHPIQRQRIADLVAQSAQEGATLWQPDIVCPESGCFYPPTLLCDAESSNTATTVEIFGPVLSVMTFRTRAEAIALANNTRYGLAASVWSENINRALDVATQVKAGVVWINSTNQFDAACGFGGYRESGFGREGGREGLYEYLKPGETISAEKTRDKTALHTAGGLNSEAVEIPAIKNRIETDTHRDLNKDSLSTASLPPIDHTAKHYINGKQVRPDSGYTVPVANAEGGICGRVGEGNRKDIRNAVEAAFKAENWSGLSGHQRAQILYYLAENLSYRREEFCCRLVTGTGASATDAQREFETSLRRLFTYAAWADKYDGAVHQPPMRGVALAVNEPLGVMGIGCPDTAPLLAFVSLFAPAVATGNRVIIVPSETFPLLATDFYQVLETSDMPAGVVNIVTGRRDPLLRVLAEHDQVDGVWYQGGSEGSAAVETAAAANMKRTWVNYGKQRDWYSKYSEGKAFLRSACEVKNIWIPYGD